MSHATEPPLVVRPTSIDDIEALSNFIDPFVRQGRLLPRTRDELEDLIEHGFVATIDGQIVGFAALEVYSIKLAELRSLAVSPQYQGHGIGKALVQACVKRAQDLKIFEIMAITSSEEFFQKCGFDFTLPGEKKALFLQTRESY